MKHYLLLFVMMLLVGLSGVVPVSVFSAESPAVDSIVETIHLNKADIDELQLLPGVGPALSERIIQYRTENGPFKSVDQLIEVKGIGLAKMAKLKPRLTIK